MDDSDDASEHPCDVAYRAGRNAAKRGASVVEAISEAHRGEDPESFMNGYWDQRHSET